MSNLWRHKDDRELYGDKWPSERDCAPCPAVWPLGVNADHKVELTEQWQYYIRAINWGMMLRHVSALFGPKKAFTNRREDDLRRDWLLRENLDRPNPEQDRVRSCSRSPLLFDGIKIATMDGTRPPLIKSGFSYPRNANEINPDAYFYHPRTHPGMFLVASIVRLDGGSVCLNRPFPNGAIYDWTDDGMPYVFWPYVACRPIYYDKSFLVKLPGDIPPSPYV